MTSFGLCLVLLLATAGLLFLPVHVLEKCGLVGFRGVLGPAPGILLLMSAAGVVYHVGRASYEKIDRQRRKQRLGESRLKAIDSLSLDERAILSLCVYNGQRSITLPMDFAAAYTLRAKGLLQPVQQVSTVVSMGFIIPEDAWSILMGVKEKLLDVPNQEALTDRIKFLARGQNNPNVFLGIGF